MASLSIQLIAILCVSLSVNFEDVRSEESKQFCLNVFDISNRTIIKASDSIAKGARYLGAPHADSRRDCEILCCDTPGCNIAVFQQNKKNDCYLFDCGKIDNFKCIFSVHDNYVAMGMMVDRSDLEKTHRHEEAKHEMDLSLLKAKDDLSKPKPVEDEQRIAESLNPQNSLPSRSDQRSSSDDSEREKYRDRYGYNSDPDQYRESNRKAEKLPNNRHREGALRGPQSMLDKSVGRPQSPFEKPSSGRQSGRKYSSGCNMDFQWMCASGECIANYDLCDGITQCRDRSDEEGDMCSKILSRKRPDLPPPPDTPKNDWQNGRNGDYGDWNKKHNSNSNNEGNENGGDKQKEEHRGRILPDQTDSAKNKNAGASEKAGPASASKISVPNKETQIISVTKEKISVERIESVGNTSLAALILGLGLSLLAIFLVFISCRLRRARKRLRRPGGKVLNASEGEFLINGMYL